MLGPGSKRRIGVVALLLILLGIRVAGARFGSWTDSDLEMFFVPSAKVALAGHPLHIYEVRYHEYPNANGPLGMVPVTMAAALAAQLGIIDDRTRLRVLVAILFAIFPLLLAREAVRTVELLRGRRLGERGRFLAYALFMLVPEAILSRGHGEQPLMLLLLLLSARSLALRRPARAGLLLGAALLTRSSTLLYLAPMALLLVANRRWRDTAPFAGSALLTVGAGLLPFAIADRENLVYSLFTSHELLPSMGGSLWNVVPGSALAAFGHRHDSAVALAASVLLSVLLVARRRGRLQPGSAAAYGLLALCSLLLPLLMKSVWAYYYVDAYVLLAILWLSQTGRLLGATVPASALLAGVLVLHVLRSHGRTWTPTWSLTMCVTTIAIMVLAAVALVRASRASGGERQRAGIEGDLVEPASVRIPGERRAVL